uniref:Lipase family member J n=1 Tax=Molossus molossus TaxID=27622 RepID=A0A7J8DQG4_MOLMO|nr:lipase family member J [Molossus molossus]
MWYLFKVITFITNLGAIHGAFRYQRSVNPETNMNISQIISYWGYPDEEYDIVTEDGYILGLYRIPYGKIKSDNNSAQRRVVYLQHGLLTSASSWISNLPNNSLGFILADAGYDVWMGNSRGTIWSRKHLYLKSNSKEFWAFSFDEMAKYDLPASIDFIVKQTGQEKIFYVLFGNKDFLPNSPFTRIIGSKLCPQKIFVKICSRILFMMCGYDQKNLNMSRVDVYMAHNPAGTSVQNILHWIQTTAPLYNVTNMNVSTATWNGANDLLADPEDVNILLSEIRNHIYHKTISHYSHIDFLFGLDVYHQVYREIIDIIQDHL